MAFGKLKKWFEEATAQVNPFDKGATAATVRSSRIQPTQTVSRPNVSVDDQVRSLQSQSRSNPSVKAANSVRINALLSNQNLGAAQMSKMGGFESALYGAGGSLIKYASPQSIAGSGLEYAGRALNNPSIKNAGLRLTNPIREFNNTTYEQAGNKYAHTGGNIAGTILASAINPAGRIGTTTNIARYGTPAAADTSNLIEQAGGSRKAQIGGGLASGIGQGVLGSFSSASALGKLPMKGVKSSWGKVGVAGLANAAENTTQQLTENKIAQKYYDPNRKLSENLLPSGVIGFGVGSGMRAATGGGKLLIESGENARKSGPKAILEVELQILRDMKEAEMRAKGPAKQVAMRQTQAQQQKVNALKRDINQGGYVARPGKSQPELPDNQLSIPNNKLKLSAASSSKNTIPLDRNQPTKGAIVPKLSGLSEDEFFQRYKPEINDRHASTTDLRIGRPQIQSNNYGQQPTPIRQLLDQLEPGKKVSIIDSSRSSVDTLLPNTINVKRTTALDKAFRSTRSIIERQGKTGKELAGMLQKSRDVEEITQANILSRLKTVASLKGKDYENFVDAVEGRVAPSNAKIAQAVNEWRTVAPEIRQRAINAGVDVGDLGPTYYPHYVDYENLFNNRNDLNIAINHMIKTGQADSTEDALSKLSNAREVSRNRRMGNLESSRLVDVPIYDKTRNSLTNYISGATRRIAQAETFGPKDEVALQKLAQIAREGGDTSAATEAFNIAVGAKKYGATGENISKVARNYISTTRLGLGAITNASQSVNTGIVTGHIRTMGSMLKQLDPKQRDFVERTGVVADSVINDIKDATGFTGKVLSKITAPGFGKVEKFNRSVAAIAGRDYAQSLAKKGDIDTLRNKLGVTGKIGKELTESQQIQAARKIVEKTQFKVDAQDLPGWVSSPAGKLVAQFRTFSYNQSKFFSNEILKPAAKGNLLPLTRLLAALPVGYAIYETKRVINNREETDGTGRKVLESFGSVGGAGLALDIFKSMVPLNGKYLDSGRRVSMAVGTFGGPAASTAADVIGSISDAIQKKNIPENNPNLEGKVGIRSGDEYFDSTQLSRFGLRQVPIIGTRLQNTFLPYTPGKKSSNNSSTNNKEIKELVSAALSTPEAKEFLKLSDTEKNRLSKTDPETAELNRRYKAIKTIFKAPQSDLPGFSQEENDILRKWDRTTKTGRDLIKSKKPEEYERYRLANLKRQLAMGEITQEKYDASLAKTKNRKVKLSSRRKSGGRSRKGSARIAKLPNISVMDSAPQAGIKISSITAPRVGSGLKIPSRRKAQSIRIKRSKMV